MTARSTACAQLSSSWHQACSALPQSTAVGLQQECATPEQGVQALLARERKAIKAAMVTTAAAAAAPCHAHSRVQLKPRQPLSATWQRPGCYKVCGSVEHHPVQLLISSCIHVEIDCVPCT